MKYSKRIIILILVVFLQSCSQSNHQIIWVSGIKSDCSSGAGKMQCLSIYKGEYLIDSNWEVFY